MLNWVEIAASEGGWSLALSLLHLQDIPGEWSRPRSQRALTLSLTNNGTIEWLRKGEVLPVSMTLVKGAANTGERGRKASSNAASLHMIEDIGGSWFGKNHPSWWQRKIEDGIGSCSGSTTEARARPSWLSAEWTSAEAS